MSRKGRPSKDSRIDDMLQLMTLVTVSPEGRVPLDAVARSLGTSEERVRELVLELSTLSVRSTGARAAVALQDGFVVNEGSEGLLPPVRLTPDEALVLSCVVEALDIDEGLRAELAETLFPANPGGLRERAAKTLASGSVRGRLYTSLVEACDVGIRCVIRYRKADGSPETSRTVDPLSVSDDDGNTYRHAWGLNAGGGRRCRSDRSASVEYTDESVEDHGPCSESLRVSLAGGVRATLRFKKGGAVSPLGWAGLESVEDDGEGYARATVMIADPSWLHRNVLAAGGDMQVLAPTELREGVERAADRMRELQRRSCACLHSSR